MIQDTSLQEIFFNLTKNASSVVVTLDILIAEKKQVLSRQYLLDSTPFSSRSMNIKAIDSLVENSILEDKKGLLFLTVSHDYLMMTRYLLQGYVWSKIERDESKLKLVMTPPKAPSTLQRELSFLGHNRSLIVGTEETYEDIARKCKDIFSIMTPFLDDIGAKHLLKLFRLCPPNSEKQLILRFLSEPDTSNRFPQGFRSIESDLIDIGVNVFDYSIERNGSKLLETFHAKVIVCDKTYAYLGSSNFHKYSIDNSMELGILLEGAPVPLLRKLLDLIVSISRKY